MAIGWFIVPYKRRPGFPPTRYCAMDDYTVQLHAAGGQWAETEVLGNRAIVKVRAGTAVLNALANEPGIRRVPKDRLDDSLADLPPAVRRALRDELEDAGYSLAEIRARFGDDLGQFTLRDVLRFFAGRRRKPRYDRETDSIFVDGEVAACRDVDEVDAEVSDA